jgi:L-threonylcarbamoyladenylate synthase
MLNPLSDLVVKQIDEAVEIMRKGGVVAFPTDTVYGLGADALNASAVEKVFKIKQRLYNLPLPVLLADESQAASVAVSISEFARCLMKKFWPGGLTLVLNGGASLPELITGGGDKVAVRVPDHIIPVTLISKLGKPVVGTSANVSNNPSVITAEEVKKQLGDDIGLIIDGGRCPGGLESTVVDVTGEYSVVLRQGAIAEEEIMQVYREYNEGR